MENVSDKFTMEEIGPSDENEARSSIEFDEDFDEEIVRPSESSSASAMASMFVTNFLTEDFDFETTPSENNVKPEQVQVSMSY